jgi:signal transduction histidine kinase/ActR/RegA family two-component response regulator
MKPADAGQLTTSSLKVKVMTFMSLMLLIVGASLSWYFLNQTRAIIAEELEKRALSLTVSLANNSRYGVLTEDTIILQELVEGMLQEEGVLFVVIADRQGKVLAQGSRMRDGANPPQGSATLALQHASAGIARITAPAIHYHGRDEQQIAQTADIYHTAAPVETIDSSLKSQEEQLASAMVLLGGESRDALATTPKRIQRGSVQVILSLEKMQTRIRQTFLTGIGLTLGTILVGVFLSFLFVGYAVTPIQAMARAARKIAAGDLSQRVEVTSRDEIGVLATTFNHMSESLQQMTHAQQQAYQQIEQLNIGLEEKIRERTGALAEANTALRAEIGVRERTERELQQAKDAAESANRYKSEFLANMSHELRTPLNAVIGFSEVLLEKMFGDVNAKQEEYLQDILSSGRHLLSLINDILDLSKIEAGKMAFEPSVFDLKELLENSLVMVREKAVAHGVALTVDITDGVGLIFADERKVKQIVFNLLSNAVKFTPDNGRVGIRAVVTDGKTQVAVWDTGIGIAPEDHQRIFDEFQQVGGKGFAAKVEGTGLGLTLVKKFIEMHNGEVWVDSIPGQGSTFTFTLPTTGVTPNELLETPLEEVVIGDVRNDAPAGPLVLVIENDPKAAQLLRIYLTEAGYTVDIATDGDEGIDKIKQVTPGVVLLDVLLPTVNGWDVLSRIKADPATQNVPVIIVSIVDEKSKGIALGATEYVVKPIVKEELLSKLRAVWQASLTSRAEG